MRYGLPSMSPPLGSPYPSTTPGGYGLPGEPGFQASPRIHRPLDDNSRSVSSLSVRGVTPFVNRFWHGGV